MAEIVSLVGTTHHPWYHHQVTRPEPSPDARKLLAWSGRVQDSFARTRPDVVVVVASDHFHQFFPDTMPQWLVGRMTSYEGTFANEEREFGLPRVRMGGHRALSTDIIEAGFEHGFDFAFSDEMKVDHACVVPMLISRPALDIPIVPVLTNCGAPPMPPGRRFVELGPALRAAIESSTAVQRVAVVVSGNLSLDVGGPGQMLPRPVDPAFDAAAMDWLTRRDFDALVADSTHDALMRHGNTAFQFLNFLTMAGMQGDLQLVHAEAMARRGSSVPCFLYEKAGTT